MSRSMTIEQRQAQVRRQLANAFERQWDGMIDETETPGVYEYSSLPVTIRQTKRDQYELRIAKFVRPSDHRDGEADEYFFLTPDQKVPYDYREFEASCNFKDLPGTWYLEKATPGEAATRTAELEKLIKAMIVRP